MSAGYIIYSLDWTKFQRLVERPSRSQLATLAQLLSDGLEENDGEFDEGDPILDWPTDAKGLSEIVASRLPLPDWYGDLSRPGKSLWEGVVFNACMNCDDIDLGFRVDNDGIGWDVIELAWKHLGVVPDTITDVALSAFGTRPYRYHQTGKPPKTRAEHDQDEARRRASLNALGGMLGQFLEGAKQGQADPDKLFEELEANKGVSQEHKNLMKSFLSDDDSADDDEDANDWSPMHSMHSPEEVEKMRTELKSVEAAIKKAKKKSARTQYEADLMPALEAIAADGRMLFIQVDT